MLHEISDVQIRKKIADRIDSLADEPEKVGKAMKDELTGYRSLRAVGQRYRIIYKVEKCEVKVVVICLGIRKDGDKKDVYKIARKLMRSGLFN